ncbi:MAG: alpha/beta hydrolase [Chloroflexota bacterium]|nr:alpha/beta hydrolase [Chloroflexota bacterium]
MLQTKSGFVKAGNTRLYYETAGEGTPMVMIHAGVADNRQWNSEFTYFGQNYQVIRYDMRGYGRSEPVEGEFSHLTDLIALLDALTNHEPFILMGCSMGGELAMDFAAAQPERVRALVIVGSAPGGLELDVPPLAKFAEAEKAWHAGDLDLLTEIETQIWFDGSGRTPDQVNQEMRRLAYEMNYRALTNEQKGLGKRLPNAETPAVERLSRLNMPVLVVVGEHDTPYILAAADYMKENLPSVQKKVIADAAHLPNMDHPDEFQRIVADFLAGNPT